MEPLGWIHTSPTESNQLSPFAAAQQYRHLVTNQNWDAETSTIATCSFTTGSCSLSLYKLTGAGMEWAKLN